MSTPTEQSRGTHWSWERDPEGIVWLCIDRADASANSLAKAVLGELDGHLTAIETARPKGLVVYSGKNNGFIAGADISEFTTLKTQAEAYALIRAGQAVLDHLAALPCPTVAAIHGFALGGGLELALACRYRVAADDGKLSLGFPEVQLGIHPGFGGTVRGPELVGARAALDLMLTGRTLRAGAARATGLVDRLVATREDLKVAAAAMIHTPPAPGGAPFLDRLLALAPLRPFIARGLEATVAKRAARAHYPAPYAIIDLWRRFGAKGRAAYDAEAESIGALFLTPTARNLVRVFFLQDRLKGQGGKGASFARVHVVGAGVMGGDIAAWCAARGLAVTLQDQSLERISPALGRAKDFFAKRLKSPAEIQAAGERLRADVEGQGVAAADVVIEAIFENVEAKQALYASLEPRLKTGALLATNTSSLMLETLAAKLKDPARLVGLHFFNPVARMPLIEIIRGKGTDANAAQTAAAFARRLDKLPLPCASAPGFVVNRILFPYLTEAMRAAEGGVALARIDECALRFGMPQGPIELADTVGLDVALNVGEVLSRAFGTPAPESIRPLVTAKKLGRKTGEGLYVWKDGKPVKPPAGPGETPADLEDRLILPMVNESVACLREGVIADCDLLDAGVIFGTGFAPFRGGPIAYARARGTGDVIARLTALAERYGPRFKPDAGWAQLERGDFDPKRG
jgi:3-hydroxyacyl-CoA dehydrogenase / enoyl-CoA hydratase / 3-hydroxybutyryl-CoA epimerase